MRFATLTQTLMGFAYTESVRRNAKPNKECEVKEDGYPDNIRAIGTTNNSAADA
jgi:hypothetical protein